MKRREILKGIIFFTAISTVAGHVSGIFSNAYAVAGAFPDEGPKFLGFQLDSKLKPVKICGTCKYFKDNKDAGADAGECILPAMKSTMKKQKNVSVVFVKKGSYCNMWQKKV